MPEWKNAYILKAILGEMISTNGKNFVFLPWLGWNPDDAPEHSTVLLCTVFTTKFNASDVNNFATKRT